MQPAKQPRPSASCDQSTPGPEQSGAHSLGHSAGGTGPSSAAAPSRRRWRILRYFLPLFIVLLAFCVRVYRLPDVPFGWHPDEASKGLLARDLLAGKYAPAFFTAFTGRDALYVYLEAACFAVFGEGILAGRLLSACVGVLTVGHAPANSLDELIRITRSGGHIVFSLRPDVYRDSGFKEKQDSLEEEGKWKLVESSEEFQPLPKGEPDVYHQVWIYRVV